MVLAGDAVPRLDADEAHRLLRRGPDQRVREVFDIHADAASGVALQHADGFGFEVHHAMAVARKQLGAQRDAGDVAGEVVIRRGADEPVRRGVQAQRGFHRVKQDVVIRVGLRARRLCAARNHTARWRGSRRLNAARRSIRARSGSAGHAPCRGRSRAGRRRRFCRPPP